jgi:branched-chain amino acid transport system ATP-binding protein
VSPPLLQVTELEVSYGDARAVFGVSLKIMAGHTLAVVGANGAGKSSLAAAVAGAVRPSGGRVMIDGTDVTSWGAHRVARLGLAYVPEGRGIFPHLSVSDNLRALLRYAVPTRDLDAALDRAFASFPVLHDRGQQKAGTLSGGEQQMLALARVLAAPPRLLIADEMSLGLAPKLVDVVFDALQRAHDEGVSILLVEQYVERALALADETLVMRHGRVGWAGSAADADAREEALSAYLGAGSVP